jgi:hypothetical protein
MPQSPLQMIEFFAQQVLRANRGLEIAVANRNYQLAALNIRQKFKGLLMQALIAWRLGQRPDGPMGAAVETVIIGLEVLKQMDPASNRYHDLPVERSVFAAFLVGCDHPLVEVDGMEDDRKLDALLGNALFGRFDAKGWNEAMRSFCGKVRSNVAKDSYRLYGDILAGTVGTATAEGAGERLFAARKFDGFFSGADQTEGGGEDNLLVVDYRLGALLKRLGLVSGGLHAWKWA